MKPEQLSRTATFIAIKFYGLTLMEPYRSWFDPEVVRFYDRLVHSLPVPFNKYHSLLQKSWIRKFFTFSEELLLPGDLLHILMRKYFIQRRIDELQGEGYRQLVVPGAGFDHLAAYYARRGIQSFEIDAPRMARIKRAFVHKYGCDNPSLSVIPAYCTRRSLLQTLKENPDLDTSRKTVIVAEGFFDYLASDEVAGIINDLSHFFKSEVVLISTIFALDELSAFRRWVFRTGVTAVGEKLQLHLSAGELQGMLIENGFTVESVMDSPGMKRSLGGTDVPLPAALKGFYLVVCQKK